LESAVPGTDAIKQAIYTYGPISVAVCAQKLFQNYSGGIFYWRYSITERDDSSFAVLRELCNF
jgi:hypothetical protein